MTGSRKLTSVVIKDLRIHDFHIEIMYELNHTYLSLTRITYHDFCLRDFVQRFGKLAEKTLQVVALLESFKFIPLFPENIDVRHLNYVSKDMCDAIKSWIPDLYAQHFFENDRSDYLGPEYIAQAAPLSFPQPELPEKKRKVLCPNGGGKDSYLVMRLLSEAGFAIGSFSSARSEYGKFELQHILQENNLKNLSGLQATHRVSVCDDVTDWHWVKEYFPDVGGECSFGRPNQVGTPEMIFYALPIVFMENYTDIAMGWERSAEFAQAYNESGRGVNHQFLKSKVAEDRYRSFIHKFLFPELNLYSVLRPLYDYKIYELLPRYADILPHIHSCNIAKPWCNNCPKCAYVFVNLCARFPLGDVVAVFGENLLEKTSLEKQWRMLLGLESHNAFECVGSVIETRMAFNHCLQKGYAGYAMDLFKSSCSDAVAPDWLTKVESDYLDVDQSDHGIPAPVFERLPL